MKHRLEGRVVIPPSEIAGARPGPPRLAQEDGILPLRIGTLFL